MLHLLVARPEMLPVSGTTGPTLKLYLDKIAREDWHRQSLSIQLGRARELLVSLDLSSEPLTCRETLEDIMSIFGRGCLFTVPASRERQCMRRG
jgi:hypothetical protein